MKVFLSFLLTLLLIHPCFAQSGYANGAGYDNGIKTGSGGGGSGTVSSGTSGQVAVYNGTTSVASGIITDNGTQVGVNNTSPTSTLQVNSGWNIGVGTASPSQALSVNGNASFNGGISTAAWTDPINDWNASGQGLITTTGSISSTVSTTTLTVGSNTGWSIGMGININGAGTAGANLITQVTNISGTTFTVANAAITTVSGATIQHDDTFALQSAVNESCFDNKNIHIRNGVYNITTAINVRCGVWIMGDGNRGRNIASGESLTSMGTLIQEEGTTADGFDIKKGDVKLTNLSIESDIALTQTAGLCIALGNGGTKILNDTIEHITCYNTFEGISVGTTVSIGYINNNVFQPTIQPLLINEASGAGDIFWTDDYFNQTNLTGSGSLIESADTEGFVNDKFLNGASNLIINDSVNGVINLRFTNCSFENSQSTGSVSLSSSGNGVGGISFTGGEAGVTSGLGDIFTIGSNVSDVNISNMILTTGFHGITVSSNKAGFTFVGNIFKGISQSGINITGVPTRVSLIGNTYDSGFSGVLNTGGSQAINRFDSFNSGGFPSAIGIGTFQSFAVLDVAGTVGPSAFFRVGNVGMGTTNPGAGLDVSTSIRSVQGGAVGTGVCWCTNPPKVLGNCTGALGTCTACNYNGSGC